MDPITAAIVAIGQGFSMAGKFAEKKAQEIKLACQNAVNHGTFIGGQYSEMNSSNQLGESVVDNTSGSEYVYYSMAVIVLTIVVVFVDKKK